MAQDTAKQTQYDVVKEAPINGDSLNSSLLTGNYVRPHIYNISSAVNYWDPVNNSVFEVCIELPTKMATRQYSPNNENIKLLLSQQVVSVSGLDALNKTAQAGNQKFYGATMSYLNTSLDDTSAEFDIKFNLNLANVTDAFVFRVFKDWAKLGYNLNNGARALMRDYIAPSIIIKQANRDGSVWRTVYMKRILLTNISGLDSLEYTANEAVSLTCKFRADAWYEHLTNGDKTLNGVNDATMFY